MPRPKKCRRVCDFPENRAFAPLGTHRNQIISLSIDEYETIRLIDKKGFSQEQCGEQMDISRTTVQLLYASARKKIADALVDGAMLQIEGGDYRLCNGEAHCLNCQTCLKHQLNQQYQKSKGDTIMRIAVTFEDGQIFQHFGRTEQFKVYDAEDGKVISLQSCGYQWKRAWCFSWISSGIRRCTVDLRRYWRRRTGCAGSKRDQTLRRRLR